jgi:CRISPR-associated exonuclease Cas4
MDLVTISSLNAYLYCPRRCALRHVEQLYVHNEYTIEGTLLHEHADTIGQEYNKNILDKKEQDNEADSLGD